MTPEPPASAAAPDHQLPSPHEPVAPRRRRSRFLIWAVILVLFGLLFYWIHSYKAGPAAAGGGRHGMTGPIPVVPATAARGSLGVYLTAIGTVTPVYTDSINSQVTGTIQSVRYREGQYVRKGQPLVDIDPAPYQAQLMEAQGALQRDEALLAEARMDLARYRLAWSKNAIPRQTLDDQQKLVLQDQGTVKNDQGVVDYDKVQLGFCHITSPIDGRVGLRLVDPGNLVTANSSTTLVVITQMRPITVIFTIAEGSLPEVLDQMRRGAKLPVQAWDSLNTRELAVGRVTSIDNQIDTTTGTVRLRAEFPNADGALFPNQFVNTKLLVTTLRNQTIVPTSAIQHNGDTAFVYLIERGAGKAPKAGPQAAPAASQTAPAGPKQPLYHVVMTTVKTGVTDGNNTGVTGIQPGDVVADSGFEKVVDGSTVTLSKVGLNIQQTSVTAESPAQ